MIHQGMLEASNVQSITQITKLIEVSRAYESVAKMMDQTSELSRSAVERLGKPQ
jgi:flagellar basal-body rod protein FlgF